MVGEEIMRSFLGRNILSLKDFERHDFMRIFQVAQDLEPYARDRRNGDLLKHKTLVTAFYQPSTRTRLCTEAAMHRLGGHVVGFSDPKMTRAGDFYQESIKDTVRMLEYYGDVIAMRHFKQGAPHEAAKWASVPVINCGDGWGEHPTQVLIDMFTIWREKGALDGLHFLLVGDMRMRTMHSIGYGISKFDITATFVAPPEMSLTQEFKEELRTYNLDFDERDSTEEGIADADVIYMEPVVQADYTQSLVEAADQHGQTPPAYRVTREMLQERGKRDSIVLHSLPRMDELPTEVDDTRHARYWVEAYNGVIVRMALLALILGAAE
jgi:aspartate carbamoyltransferase catalytic subunit